MPASKGALLDLVARGIQDLPLIGNPQITYFKQVFKRHTNFSRDSIQIPLNGGLSFGTKITCKIPRSGDLLSGLVLELDFPELTATGSDSQHEISYIPYVGFAAIDYIEIKIQGQTIDKQYGEWLYIWSQLSKNYDKRITYDYMVKATPQNGPFTAYVPLTFWFCRNYGSALPLVALSYHEIELEIQLKPLDKLYYFGELKYYDLSYDSQPSPGVYQYTKTAGISFIQNFNVANRKYVYKLNNNTTAETTINQFIDSDTIRLNTQLPTTGLTGGYIKPTFTITNPTVQYRDIRLYGDYINLDIFEQKHFAKNVHRYLIEQIKFSENIEISANSNSLNYELDFNLSVKELIWVKQINDNFNNNLLLNFESTPDQYYELPRDDISRFMIKYNGEDRINERNGEYFRLLQPLDHHTNTPHQKYIYCYSYALEPEKIDPSGISNFSKIDKVNLNFTFNESMRASKLKIFAINYNILRIEQGMGGIAFSN